MDFYQLGRKAYEKNVDCYPWLDKKYMKHIKGWSINQIRKPAIQWREGWMKAQAEEHDFNYRTWCD